VYSLACLKYICFQSTPSPERLSIFLDLAVRFPWCNLHSWNHTPWSIATVFHRLHVAAALQIVLALSAICSICSRMSFGSFSNDIELEFRFCWGRLRWRKGIFSVCNLTK
jgi:hypothetical protein